LADAASRLMVSVSSESSLIREENKTSVNEEMRQRVKQSIEKIDFTNFKVSKSEKVGNGFYVEVEIERDPFIKQQKEKVYFLEKQISDLDKNSKGKNAIQRRNSLVKIVDLGKELDLKSRILAGAGEDVGLKEKLSMIADFQNELNKTSDKIEFYFEINSPAEIAKVIRSSLNKEKIKTSPKRNSANPNQIVIRIKSDSRSNKIYEAYMTKLDVDFENLAEGKVVASNSVEVTGSSTIGEKESYAASIKSLEEKIDEDGILKIIGIIN
jgi:tRNA threonylcarbamoyladenosine modification (KEOPS) complex  Pcc1 subunit